ncbi:MAG: hypothetical protein U0237_06240 [Thermoleophilia bacterium]
MADRNGARPAYLVVHSDDDGTYVGGLMLTDESGLPVDFRYTDPITPTRLQRALYGGALDRYLRADVVAATLLKAASEPPTVLLVEDESLLDAIDAECPVAVIGPSRVPPLGAAGTTRTDTPGETLVQVTEGANPVRISLADPARTAEVTAALVALGARMDPLEPTDRVRAALELIAAGESV